MALVTLARRYAVSLYLVCKELKIEEQILQELKTISVISKSKKVSDFIRTPAIPNSIKQKIVVESLAKSFNPLLMHFLKLLIQKNRFELINSLIKSYEELKDADRNIVNVEVKSFKKVDQEYLEKIKNSLKKALGKDIKFTQIEDKSILGGISLSYFNTLIDGTLKGELQDLRENLLSAG